jgi:hypothetical protein
MPCKKCKDGKYKWGNTGECKYDTKDECEKANPKHYNDMKNTPTPLGKKTYEEYEKELKEFNLSKVERVELAVKDYEKFSTQLESLNKEIRKEADNVIEMYEKLRPASVAVRKKSVELNGIIERAEKQRDKDVKAAKELGVDANVFIKAMGSLYKLQNKGDEIIENMIRRTK